MQFKKIFFYISILSTSYSSVAMEPPQGSVAPKSVSSEKLTPTYTPAISEAQHSSPVIVTPEAPAPSVSLAHIEPIADIQRPAPASRTPTPGPASPAPVLIEPAAPQQAVASRAFPHDYYDEVELAARHRAKGKDPAPRIEPAIPQRAEDKPATAAQASANIKTRIQEGQERLRRCNLVFPICRTPKHTVIIQPQTTQPEDQLEPKYLVQTLKLQLAEAQQCTKSLFPLIIPHANKIGQIYNALRDTYKFFIIDNIVRSIQFLKTQEAVAELEQIGTKFNELIKPHLSETFTTNLSELYYVDARLATLARNHGDISKLRDDLHVIYKKLQDITINFNAIIDENTGEELRDMFSTIDDFKRRFGEFIEAPDQQLLEDLPQAQENINRIISKINELSRDRLTTTALVNIPDSELHHVIATFLPNIHQLESFQMTVMCNDISSSICSASPALHQQICLKFNELLDCSKKQATVEQQKAINKHYLQLEELTSLDRVELNKLLSKRLLDLNKYAQTFHLYVRQVVQPYVQDTNLQESLVRIKTLKEIKRSFEDILQKDSPYADGRTIIDKLFDETREITNQHRESVLNANQTIDTLRMYLTNFLHQEDITLEKCDLNLVKEIETFLASTNLSLSDAHNKIAQLTDKIKATTDSINSIQPILETIIEKEISILSLSQQHQSAPDESAVRKTESEQQHSRVIGFFKTATKKLTTAAIGFVADRAQTKALSIEEIANRAELSFTQETLQNEIMRLDSLVQQLRDAAKAEYITLQNLQTLCTILDSHKNPHFRLSDQEKIEESLAKDILKSNLSKMFFDSLHSLPEIPLISSLLKHVIQKIEPAANVEMLQIKERNPHYPPLGQIVFGTIDLFKRYRKHLQDRQPKYQDDPRQLDTYQEEQPAFDDRYTSWLINTKNPQYVLYDIAARTRFNTGRFTPFIKPSIHWVEQHVLGGPYGKTENKHDPEELRKYPDYKVDARGNIMYKIKRDESGEFIYQSDGPEYELDQQGERIPIAIRKFVQHACEHYEQPGERYTDIMHMASDAIPLEHAWALLQLIPPCAVRTAENILRVASQKAYEEEWLGESPLPAAPEVQHTISDADEPFVSTSATTFVWNGLKKLSRWPIRRINALYLKALQYWTPYLHQTVNIITGPFIDSLPYKIVATAATKTKSFVQPKIHSFKVQSCRKVRSFLYYLAANQMRLLESKIRQQKPVSDLLSQVNAQIKRHSAHGLIGWLLAEGAYNAAEIRRFARQYETLGRIDPIIQIDQGTQFASIKHYELRKKLGSLIEGWEAQPLVQHT